MRHPGWRTRSDVRPGQSRLDSRVSARRRSRALDFLALPVLVVLGANAVGAQAPEPKDLADLELEELGRVRVTVASLAPDLVRDAPSVVSVVTREQIALYGARGVVDLIDRVVGMSVLNAASQNGLVMARGDRASLFSSHVLLLLDGRPVRTAMNPGQDQTAYLGFPLETLERIEVIRGPGSVLYGSGAYTAVVNLVTRAGETRESGLRLGGGELGQASASAWTAREVGGTAVLATARWSRRDGWSETLTDSRGVTQVADLDEEQASAVLALRRGGWSGTLYGVHQRLDTWGAALAFPERDGTGRRLLSDVGHTRTLRPGWTAGTHLTFSFFETELVSRSPSVPRLFADHIEWIAEHAQHLERGPWRGLAGGYALKLRGHQKFGSAVALPEQNRTSGALYAQADRLLGRGVKATAGAQALFGADDEVVAVPRLGLTWRRGDFGPGAKLLYGEAYLAAPLVYQHINAPGLAIGNPDLRSERIGTLEAQVNWQSPGAEAELTGFRSAQRDPIRIRIVGGESHPQNAGTYENWGIETSGRWRSSRGWQGEGSVSWQCHAEDDTVDAASPMPEWIVRAGAGYARGRWSAGVFDIWYDAGRDIRLPGSPRIDANPPAGPAHLVTANASAQLLVPKGSRPGLLVTVRVDNLLDVAAWQPDIGRGPINTFPRQPGRAIVAMLEARWAR